MGESLILISLDVCLQTMCSISSICLVLVLQGDVTLVDSILTPATAVKKFDLELWALTA